MMKGWSRSQWMLLTVLMVGYTLFYLCRSNLSVARGLIIDEQAAEGWTKATIGLITSTATAFYALGKFVGGAVADKHGGRTAFLAGVFGAVVFNLLFAMGGAVPFFTLAWAGNRFLQAFGWPGIVKLSGGLFPSHAIGRGMAIVSLSYLFGDFISRKILGWMLLAGLGWRQLFLFPALALLAFSVAAVFVLRSKELPMEERSEPHVRREARKNLFKAPAFWAACGLSFAFTLARETMAEWTPTVLTEVGKLPPSAAADLSAYIPLAGGISVLMVGWIFDRVAPHTRGLVVAGGLALGGLIFIGMAWQLHSLPPLLLTLGTACAAFAFLGPHALLVGAVSLDLGGDETSATASGWIDGVGYIGGMISGYGVAALAVSWGWQSAFASLGGLSLIAALLGIIHVIHSKQVHAGA